LGGIRDREAFSRVTKREMVLRGYLPGKFKASAFAGKQRVPRE